MIDETIVREALLEAWNEAEDRFKPSLYHRIESLDEVEEFARIRFCDALAKRIPRESRTLVRVDDLARLLRDADPSITISETRDGIVVTTAGETFGVSVHKGYEVSVHSRERHVGWSATCWSLYDIAAAIIAMGHFETLSIPLKDDYRKRCEEMDHRSDVLSAFRSSSRTIRNSVRAALEENRDTEAYRDAYLSLRTTFYEDLGDPFDTGTLERDWRSFVGEVADSIETEKRLAAYVEECRVRKEAKERKKKACEEEISRALGRECSIERRSPFYGTHWDEYLITLASGQTVRFRDFEKKIGAVTPAIIAVVPILEEFAALASTKLSLGNCSSRISRSSIDQTYYRKEFLRMAGNDEILLRLAEMTKSRKASVILQLVRRSVKVFCFYPGDRDSAVSFTLKKPFGTGDVDRLADSLSRFTAAMRKHPCNLG